MRKEQTQKADALLNERVECKSAAALGSEALVSRSMKSPFGKEVPMTMHKMYELLQGVAQVVVGGLWKLSRTYCSVAVDEISIGQPQFTFTHATSRCVGSKQGCSCGRHTQTWTDKI